MYTVKVDAAFEAAHRVDGYPGKCNRLHGHSWIVQAQVSGTELDELGMLVDFKVVKAVLNDILDMLDHRYLNELEHFSKQNPTAENLARFVFEELEKHEALQGEAKLKSVEVWESPKTSVIYTKD